MLDFGWTELFLVVALAVIVIGPKEFPVIMVALGRVVRRLQYIKFAVSKQFEDVMREADLDDIRKGVNFEEKYRQNYKTSNHVNNLEFDEELADEALLDEVLENQKRIEHEQ